jgi:hypothetical protein
VHAHCPLGTGVMATAFTARSGGENSTGTRLEFRELLMATARRITRWEQVEGKAVTQFPPGMRGTTPQDHATQRAEHRRGPDSGAPVSNPGHAQPNALRARGMGQHPGIAPRTEREELEICTVISPRFQSVSVTSSGLVV